MANYGSIHKLLHFFILFLSFSLSAQHKNEINATLNDSTKQIEIQQKFTYVNNSEDGLSVLYFNDWNHAYANRNTALAKRFGEQFKRSLHLGKDSEKGDTHIVSIVDNDYIGLDWNRVQNKDIIRIKLEKTLEPSESAELFFTYNIKLPHKKFTQYGYTDNGEYYLKDWYLVPAVYDKEWKLYDNMNLDDIYTDVANTNIDFSYPEKLFLASNFDKYSPNTYLGAQHIILRGTNRKNCEIILSRQKRFTKHVTRFLTVTTDLSTNKYDDISQGISIDKIAKYIDANLGRYPHGNLLVSQINYNKTPLYGINQLPSFIRPYKEQFQFEMKFLKTAINSFLEETLFLDPRAERWVSDAIANYLMIKYVEDNYPNQKLAGKLSNLWGFRSFHLAKMDFNEQYALLSMFAARKNIDQALSTPNDSLIKFNEKIANSYKAGLGMYYLSDYLGNKEVDSSILSFYKTFSLKPKVKAVDFRNE
ncbi:MAG: metalloprotease, partial [Bacteroidota bacterium]